MERFSYNKGIDRDESISEDKVMVSKKRMKSEPVFKPYQQDQLMLLPPSLEELIPANHVVRILNDVIDKLDISSLISTYKGGGTSSYHPRMLLKVLLYAYVEGIYTSRKIAKALRENVHFMWLSGMSYPDFRTINNFRSGRLSRHIDEIFASLLLFLEGEGYVDLSRYFVDGTIFRANANKHSYVWKKNVKRYRQRVLEKVRELLEKIEALNRAEDELYGSGDLPELGKGEGALDVDVSPAVDEINKLLNDFGGIKEDEQFGQKSTEDAGDDLFSYGVNDTRGGDARSKGKAEGDKATGKLYCKLEEDLLPRLERYNKQLGILGNRNSYSKTDPDATFIRHKDGQLLPGYNVLLGSQNQFIINYSLHQSGSDKACLIPHMEKLFRYQSQPDAVVADAGFGSEENYQYLRSLGITGYLKNPLMKNPASFSRERNCRRQDLIYVEAQDVYQCPEGRQLVFKEHRERTNASGYRVQLKVYESESCASCHRRAGSGNRKIEVSHTLEELRREAQRLLETPEGQSLCKRRGVEIESIFGNIKHNMRFQRFHLRGKLKVNVEIALVSMAHNLIKLFTLHQQLLPS